MLPVLHISNVVDSSQSLAKDRQDLSKRGGMRLGGRGSARVYSLNCRAFGRILGLPIFVNLLFENPCWDRFTFSRCWCVFAIVWAMTIANVAAAQESLSETQWKRGFHGFNLLGQNAGLIHQSMENWEAISPTEKILVVLGDVKELPVDVNVFIAQGGSALFATDQYGFGLFREYGIELVSTVVETVSPDHVYQNFLDCPIVDDFRSHRILENVDSIVTNRPGRILVRSVRAESSPDVQEIAYLPQISRSFSNPDVFVVVMEKRNRERLICIADQSVFSNQMLLCGDNARFTNQVWDWLKGQDRRHVLVIADGKVILEIDPSQIEIETVIPAPTRQEIMDALGNLPPSAMLEFGNAFATVVEDENIVNEFIGEIVDSIPRKEINRIMIFFGFGLICLISMVTYVWQKKLNRNTASELAFQRFSKQKKLAAGHGTQKGAWERQRAAGMLLDSFCLEIANRRHADWPSFPDGLGAIMGVDGPSIEKPVLKSMKKATRKFKTKQCSYWTAKRLGRLEQDVSNWKTLRNN